jgi:hypothetical protein
MKVCQSKTGLYSPSDFQIHLGVPVVGFGCTQPTTVGWSLSVFEVLSAK